METTTFDFEDLDHHMHLAHEAFKEFRLTTNPEKRAIAQAKLEKIFPGHRAQIPIWLMKHSKE